MKKRYGLWNTVRDFWQTGKAGFALFLISLFGVIYSYMALAYEIGRGLDGHVSVQNIVKDISAFMPVGAFLVGIIVGGIDVIMLLSDWYLARQEKRIQAAQEVAKAEGLEQGVRENAIENTIAVLSARFPSVDVNTLKITLDAIQDLERLKALNLSASLASSFEAFLRALED